MDQNICNTARHLMRKFHQRPCAVAARKEYSSPPIVPRRIRTQKLRETIKSLKNLPPLPPRALTHPLPPEMKASPKPIIDPYPRYFDFYRKRKWDPHMKAFRKKLPHRRPGPVKTLRLPPTEPEPKNKDSDLELKTRMDPQIFLDKNLLFWLRDACSCPRCVDVSTNQKLFQTIDIPTDIMAVISEQNEDQFKVSWKGDIPVRFKGHVSTYSKDTLLPWLQSREGNFKSFATATPDEKIELWHTPSPGLLMRPFQYDAYLASDETLWAVLLRLKQYGLAILNEVPRSEDAVENIASRIGQLRDTFYGRTWDVTSVPEATNVAYTNQSLGLHMDLLYMADPPGLQFLHCLENSCEGGTSMFADGFRAALQVMRQARPSPRPDRVIGSIQDVGYDKNSLTQLQQTFHYRNAGHHYQFKRPIIQLDLNDNIMAVNWSPPFQAPFERSSKVYSQIGNYVQAARSFAVQIGKPSSQFKYRMKKGDCVIFDNRRILHGREGFDVETGERWLKGAYIDTDVFNSRYRGLQQSQMFRRVVV